MEKRKKEINSVYNLKSFFLGQILIVGVGKHVDALTRLFEGVLFFCFFVFLLALNIFLSNLWDLYLHSGLSLFLLDNKLLVFLTDYAVIQKFPSLQIHAIHLEH